MSYKVKHIDIKDRTYLVFNDMINRKNFDPKNIKLDEKSNKNIIIYYIRCLRIKYLKCVKIYGVNPLYLVFNKVNRCFEEINVNKYLTVVPTNKAKKKNLKNMKNYEVKPET